MLNKNTGFTSLFGQEQHYQQGQEPHVDLGMLAKWGKPLDNEIRNFGSQMQSPTIDPATKLNFEQRILNPEKYPQIDNGDGSMSTHRMAYGEADGKFVAFPTIVQVGDNKLVRLEPMEAFHYAMKNNEYRSFDKEEDAASYSDGGYKKFWGLGSKR